MRFVLLFTAATLAGIATAAPQKINFIAAADLPTPSVLGPAVGALTEKPTYNPATAAAEAAAAVSTGAIQKNTLKKRTTCQSTSDPCCPQPDGYGPIPSPDSDSSFLSFALFSSTAQSASAPNGYSKSFTNLQASTEEIGYLGLYTLQSYDAQQCADHCDQVASCYGFNLYYERDPSIAPADACPNPSSITNYKCTLYGYPLIDKTATNVGQWRGPQDSNGQAFHVVIAGSDGFSKTITSPPAVAGYGGAQFLGSSAINAPSVNGHDSYMGMLSYNDGPFDPSRCAAACTAQTQFDHDHTPNGVDQPCNFFNAYILLKDGVPQGTVCSFYDQTWDPSYATNDGQWGSDGAHYTIWGSITYSVTSS